MISLSFASSYRTLAGSGYTWWSGNARFIQLSGKFLGAHIAHGSLMLLWAGSMGFFEISHLLIEKPLYEQGMIVIPHMANLGLGVGPGGELSDIYSYVVISSLYLLSSGVLALGGIYHSIFGLESLEDSQKSYIFSFSWTDRAKISSILGIHLVFIGLGSLFLVVKGLFLGGIYDSWAAGGGDIRLIRYSSLTLNFIILGRYLLRAPFGGQGSIISVNNLEDLLGGHVYVGFGCILGGL
jgi:photosystem II CP43 chlorophyll apoprotein